MNIHHYIIFSVLILGFSSCKNQEKKRPVDKIVNKDTTDLQLDHLNIWVNNPEKAKEQLINIGFTAVPDSLSQIHHGQGTTGRYFHFLNSYLELIFVYDQNELEENNNKNKALDFTERANFEKNDASPFSLALKVKDYNVTKIPFKIVRYHQDWMGDSVCIYSARNSKTHLKEPSIFVVYPEIESEQFETLADLKNIPDEYAFARAFYKHPNGAKKITSIKITSRDLDPNTTTIKALNLIDNLSVKKGKDHLMELYFDNNIQGKSYDLRPETPLIIYL